MLAILEVHNVLKLELNNKAEITENTFMEMSLLFVKILFFCQNKKVLVHISTHSGSHLCTALEINLPWII